ncbi:MAG: AAA family ATPase [Acidimicrobiales bacterium]
MGGTLFGNLVTVSATYGAGGSVIAPRLAEALELPFVDRLISADLSQDAARREREAGSGAGGGGAAPAEAVAHSEEGLSEGEEESTPAGRFLSYFARAASVGSMVAPDPMVEDDESMRARAEEGLRELAAGAPAVLLGRAGAVVLASRPRAYHVRLDGPVERRVAWAADFEGIDVEAASRRQEETDRVRRLFVKRLFRVDPSDASLYHLVLDPTVIGVDAAVEVVSSAARAYFGANPA